MTLSNRPVSRRALIKRAGLLGCSLAAHPLMTTMTLADAPWDNRLVVLILRGGMDGLDAVQPVGDPDYAVARPKLASGGGHDLGGFFALHDGLGALMPLWQAGELSFAHAVSTPYRDKRSHFDGQDLLEAGTGMDAVSVRDGWLNRLLQTLPGLEGETAYAIGRDHMKLLEGPADVANWAPSTRLEMSAQAELLLQEIYHDHPLFLGAASEAVEIARTIKLDRDAGDGDADMMAMMEEGGGMSETALAAFAADRLRRDTRIAAFSINGWDTHRGQAGTITRGFDRLTDAILTLKQGLGPIWGKTTVIAMTEFGRTLRENGSGGTDHGTGGAMVFAGGAVAGGRVHGVWPGLAEADLYDRRDLMPTGDVRAYAAWAMRSAFGIERGVLESAIFPGLEMGDDPGLLL